MTGDWRAIHRNPSRLDPVLNPGPAELGQHLGQIVIEALACVFFREVESQTYGIA